ncbi:MAG: hypothetical protein ACI4NI_08555 [Candidatus Ornithospirochaeta sp.]
MTLIPGVTKDDHSDYVLYFIENLSDELKQEIRDRLSAICHGEDLAKTTEILMYSYKETAKEFVKRYRANETKIENRNKGMIGELLTHVIIGIENRFMVASPFFNMEERSLKKGFDITLFEELTKEMWFAEVKSGSIHKGQKNVSSAAIELINNAKKDIKDRLNGQNVHPWQNAINAAKVAMDSSKDQKAAILELLGQCANNVVGGNNSSESFNVVLSASLFNPLSDRIEENRIGKKYSDVVQERLFKKVYVVAIQEETYEEVFKFLNEEAYA